MALINTLRNKFGKYVVILIAIAIISFVLADLTGSNSPVVNDQTSVGEINGQEISIREYQGVLDFQKSLFQLYSGRSATDNDSRTLNEQTWNWLKGQYAFGEQYDQLGIDVSEDEYWDMLQGQNIDPTIQQFFTNPQTGQFDRQQFNQFYANRNSNNVNPQSRAIWNLITPTLIPARKRLKYENLLIKSTYVTNAEGIQSYSEQSDVADISYLFVPYYTISDTAVSDKVTEALLKENYNKNKSDYQTENLRSIKYVRFSLAPSAEDSAVARDAIQEIKADFATVDNDSTFAFSVSDGQNYFNRYNNGNLPQALALMKDSLKEGQIIGPTTANEAYRLQKISRIYDDSIYYARARHILIKWSDETDEAKAEAKQLADSVLQEIQGGANFAIMASRFGTDGTAQRGGDLGWFGENDMVKGFSDAVFAKSGTGLLNQPVETEFGYHIIEVTEEKTNKVYAVATVEKDIIVSDNTQNAAYQKADYFRSITSNQEEFEANAKKDSLMIYQENEMAAMDQFVGDLGNARRIVQWAFKDGEVDKVSDLFTLDEYYIVAVMTDNIEKGYRPLEDVRAQVEEKVKNELIAEMISEKLLQASGTLEERAAAFGEGAEVFQKADLKMTASRLENAGAGTDAETIGKIFSLQNGQTSKPFAARNGVLMVRMNNRTEAPEVADYSSFKLAVEATRRNSTSSRIEKAIEKASDVVDKRYVVY